MSITDQKYFPEAEKSTAELASDRLAEILRLERYVSKLEYQNQRLEAQITVFCEVGKSIPENRGMIRSMLKDLEEIKLM